MKQKCFVARTSHLSLNFNSVLAKFFVCFIFLFFFVLIMFIMSFISSLNVFIAFFFLFFVNFFSLLFWFQYYQKFSTHKLIRATFIKNMSALMRSIGNSSNILSDAITTIRQIICPSLRSVSLQLLTPK